MRIAFFTNNYLPRASGVAHAVENMRIELEHLGHDVFIFAPKYGKKNKGNSKLFRYKSFRMHKKWGPLSSIPFPHSKKIEKRIKDLSLNIIHSHHPYLLGKTAQKYAKELRIPLVFTVHTPYYQYLQYLAGGLGEVIDTWLLDILAKYANKCDLVIAPTKTVKNSLKEAILGPIIRIIPSGIDIEKFSKCTKEEARARLGIDASKIILLAVSRLSYEKNVDFLIETFSQIASTNKRIELIIIGGGPQKLKLQSLAKSFGLKDRVIFKGKLPYDALPLYYAASDILLYSSLVDTQGLVLCEAMASSLPIVSTNQAMGPKSLVKDNIFGYLVGPNVKIFAEKTLDLIHDGKKRQKFGINAKIEARRYDRKLIAKQLEKTYRELIKKK